MCLFSAERGAEEEEEGEVGPNVLQVSGGENEGEGIWWWFEGTDIASSCLV